MGAPGFWDDQARAAALSTEHSRITRKLERYERLARDYDDARELLELGDDGLGAEIGETIEPLERELERLQEEALFMGEYDAGDALLEIHAGTGGTDAQDWAEMVLRMYLRWASDRGFETEILEASAGEEAGLKSAAVSVRGENAYGVLRAERGVHRLVRLSPFDAAHRRHTAFAQVVVAPLLPDDAPVEIDEADLRIDTYRASGAGGQHVNKTESAVRLTHIPSGIVVACQTERSQHKNRDRAWKMLRARMYEQELQKRESAARALHDAKSDIGWGHQIRSYVLQPYQMVKDLRTGFQTSDTKSVLDGDIDGFLRASLMTRLKGAPTRVEDIE